MVVKPKGHKTARPPTNKNGPSRLNTVYKQLWEKIKVLQVVVQSTSKRARN